jgi:hypothetical protein
MRTRDYRPGLAALLLAGAAACSSKPGYLSVHLVDAPGDYEQVNLHVVRVEVNGPGGWTTLSEPDQTYDLLTLRGGVFATLAPTVSVPAGDYSQVRLVLGSGNTVKLAGGAVEDLVVPSGLQSGLKIVCNTHIGEGESRDVFIDLDAEHSVFLHDTGSGKYILRPVVHCVDQIATGSISGQLGATTGEITAPLAGATVTAQTLDSNGAPTVVRTVTTAADGKYTLSLLPLGATYYVVTQPVVGGAAYAARASGPLPLTPAATTGTWSTTYTGIVDSGSVAGTITPTAGAADADDVFATQPLDAGGTSHRFVVRSTTGSVAAGVESYAMATLPVGTYAVQAVRRTLSGGVETVTPGTAVNAVVTSGATATTNLTIP